MIVFLFQSVLRLGQVAMLGLSLISAGQAHAREAPDPQSLVLSEAAIEEQARLKACLLKLETDAEEGFEDALRWRAEAWRPPARECLAAARVALGSFDKAGGEYYSLSAAPEITLPEERARLSNLAGTAFMLAENWEKAKEAFARAHSLRPEVPAFRLDTAFALEKLEDWEGVKVETDAVIAAAPTHPEALLLRARAHLGLADVRAAEQDIDAAIKADPKNVEARLTRGEIRQARARLTRPAQNPDLQKRDSQKPDLPK